MFGIDIYRFEGSEPIKVTVGAEGGQKTWYLPKKVLTHCSPFFDAALNGSFVEASSKAVNLPEDDPLAFEIWTTWLSLGKCQGLFEFSSFDHAYVRAWILGDKLACPAFKDHVMFQFIHWFDSAVEIWPDLVHTVYEVCPPGSKLRRLFVDWYVWDKLRGRLAERALEFITLLKELPEFLEDVVTREVMAGTEITDCALEKRHQYYENPAFKPDAWDWE